jgi:hypothetical protein
MIVHFRKQLIQWKFLKRRHAQNLQKSVERKLQGQPLLDDRDKRVNCDGHPDLGPDGILRRPVKRFNPQVLFDPTEEQFDLPAELIELSDHQRGQKKIIRQESQVAVIFPIIKANSPKRLGIIGFRFRAGQNDRLIRGQVHGFIYGSRRDSTRLEIRLGPDDEKNTILMKSVEPGKVQIPSIHEIEGAGFERQLVEDPHIIRFSIRHMDKSGDRSTQVEERMELDSAFPLAEKGPGEKREAQVDRGRIESVNRVLEIQSEIFVLIESTGFGDEDSGEVGEDSPVARFVGMGQIVARDVAANAHVVEPVFHGSQTGYDIAKAFPVGQLGESQAEELVEAREGFDFVIPAVSLDAFPKLVKRQERHDLGENGRRGVHRSLLGVRKSADYTKTRSNRLRSNNALSFSLCA